MLRRALATGCLGLTLTSCMSEQTCPERQPNHQPASTASAWVEVTAPRDVSLLQAAARVVLPGDRQGVIRPIYRARIARFHVQAGDRVRVGQPVVDVVMPEVVVAAADYRGAQLRSATQTARRDKLGRMRDEGLVAERDVFEVATRAAEVEQQALTAAATLRAAGLDPRARASSFTSPRSPSAATSTASSASSTAASARSSRREPCRSPSSSARACRASRPASSTPRRPAPPCAFTPSTAACGR
ncbi:hypothetical protein [Nannocystis pusilla]|uniref:hypothetical protein n=1 Tax=Nannocystis pusilla TaxID=889268 RepID=UPI003B7F57EF